MISISQLLSTNVIRAKRWHGESDWSPLEWAGAMCGEAGEAANAAKKLKRIDDKIANINELDRKLTERNKACQFVAREIADVFMYGVILADRVGMSPEQFEEIIIDVFDGKSIEYGFPERLNHEHMSELLRTYIHGLMNHKRTATLLNLDEGKGYVEACQDILAFVKEKESGGQ